jgi:hypothetical protein
MKKYLADVMTGGRLDTAEPIALRVWTDVRFGYHPTPSPARDIQRNESENDAARPAAEVLEEITYASERGGLGDDHEGENIPESKLSSMLNVTTRGGPDYVNQYRNPLPRQPHLCIPPSSRIRFNISSLQQHSVSLRNAVSSLQPNGYYRY